jgi:hypothetical protein
MNLQDFQAVLESQGAEFVTSTQQDTFFSMIFMYKDIPIYFTGVEEACGIDVVEIRSSATTGEIDYKAMNKINRSVKYLTVYATEESKPGEGNRIVFLRYTGITGKPLEEDLLLNDVRLFQESIVMFSKMPANPGTAPAARSPESPSLQ